MRESERENWRNEILRTEERLRKCERNLDWECERNWTGSVRETGLGESERLRETE